MKLEPPDAHLRQALRHAPDARLQAPPELSAQILAAAHRAKADQPPLPAGTPRLAWPWSRRWSLGTSGALASLLLAGVIGVLWRGDPPGPARERLALAPAPAVVAATPAPAALQEVTAPPQSPAAAASFRRAGTGASADAVERAKAVAQPAQQPWADATARGAVLTQIGRDTMRPVDAAWLEGLSTLTAGAWRPDALAQEQVGDVILEWRLGQQTLGRLWLDGQRARWCPVAPSAGTCQMATLPPQAAAGLKEKLPR